VSTIGRRARLADVLGAVRAGRALGRHDRLPRAELLARRQRALDELWAFARERAPFYRDRDPAATLDKATMMERYDELLTGPRLSLARLEAHVDALSGDELLDGEYRVMATGGTSGRRAVLPYSRAEWRLACSSFFRWQAMTGRRPRPRKRIAVVMAPSPQHMTWRYAATLDVGLMDLLRLDATRPIGELVDALQRHRPQELNGYTSVLALLAVEQLEGRLDIAPGFVATTSEVRTPEVERLITEAWGVAPDDGFGVTEAGLIGVGCSHREGMHLFEDHTAVEVLDDDGRPVADGELGRLVVTPLHGRTLPLLRYEIADLVRVTAEPCPCGRPYARLLEVQGRRDDVLSLPGVDGGRRPVHPIVLRSPMATVPGLVQYQVICEGDDLRLLLVLRDGADAGATAREVRERVARALADAGALAGVHAEVVPELRRGASGKQQLVVGAAPAAPARA
jgi:phenylacetate-coenzyme A ligase PaaK-like adenylate-forming protein